MANAAPTLSFGKITRKQYVDILANEFSYGVASGGAATVTALPNSGKKAGIAWIDCAYRVAPTAGSIQASDGTTVWGPFTLERAGLYHIVFDPPLLFKKDGTITVSLADGGQTKDLYVKFVEEGNVNY